MGEALHIMSACVTLSEVDDDTHFLVRFSRCKEVRNHCEVAVSVAAVVLKPLRKTWMWWPHFTSFVIGSVKGRRGQFSLLLSSLAF